MQTTPLQSLVLAIMLLPTATSFAAPPQTPAAAASAAAFSKTVIWVADVRKTAEFYHTVFGLKTFVEMKLGGNLWLELDTGSTKLSFMSESDADQVFGKNFRRNRPHKPRRRLPWTFASAMLLRCTQPHSRPGRSRSRHRRPRIGAPLSDG
jgi:hypothetical protein